MKVTKIILPVALSLTILSQAQQEPVQVAHPVFFSKSSPLRELDPVPPGSYFDGPTEVIEFIKAPHREVFTELPEGFPDPVIQDFMGVRDSGSMTVNVEGIGNLQNKIPPDTEGDVGPDHYVQMINMSLAVFDKQGTLVYGPVASLTLWQEAPGIWSEYSNGDPIVLYDESADRWLISELSFPYHPNGPYYEKIAVSETGDPTGAWFLYGYQYDYFCDYPKLGVWHDGYYMTANNNEWVNSQWDFHAVGVSVFERDSMLAGSPDARRIFFDLYPNKEPWSVLPADFDGTPPPDGTPEYLAYYKEAYPDRIGIFSVNTNWDHPENSTIALSQTLYPMAFTGNLPDGIPQPDGAPYLASLSNRLLYRLQYRNFGNYQAMVTNHTVNAGNDVAGIRWYEFRDSGGDWQIHQQGTYSPDNTCRWMGSAAMDGYGNIALGYSVSGSSVYPSIRFTGRFAGDITGIMTLQESEIIAGSGVQLNPNHRWGDYSSMSVDPADQATFWYTQEYYAVSGDRSWQTRIASFAITDPLAVVVYADYDSICRGDSTTLHALPTGGNGDYSFNWSSDPPGFISQLQDPMVGSMITTTYICSISDGIASTSASLKIHVMPAPSAYAGPDTLISATESFTAVHALAESYSFLEWSSAGDGVFEDNNMLAATYMPGGGDILLGEVLLSLTAFPLNTCQADSDTMRLQIGSGTGILLYKPGLGHAMVRPNPSGGRFQLCLGGMAGDYVILSIRQVSGQVLYQDGFLAESGDCRFIDLGKAAPGIYIAKLSSRRGSLVFKIAVK